MDQLAEQLREISARLDEADMRKAQQAREKAAEITSLTWTPSDPDSAPSAAWQAHFQTRSAKPSAMSRCPAFRMPPRPSRRRLASATARPQTNGGGRPRAWTPSDSPARSRPPSPGPGRSSRRSWPSPCASKAPTAVRRRHGDGSSPGKDHLRSAGHQVSARRPDADDIAAEARHDARRRSAAGRRGKCARDRNPDRQQARRVLRWLTGAADAIPLLDPGRGRYVGARFHFARTDEEIRRVRSWAHARPARPWRPARRHPQWQAERPWQWPAWWMNAAWLRGTIAYLNWVLGDQHRNHYPVSESPSTQGPRRARASYRRPAQDPRRGCGAVRHRRRECTLSPDAVMQGHEGQPDAEPDRYPPPQWGEAVEQAHNWVTGEDLQASRRPSRMRRLPPLPRHRRCSCEAAGYCLRGQCPACIDQVCNAAWAAIEENYDQPRPAEHPHRQQAHPDGREGQVSLLDELRDMGWSSGGYRD